MQTYPSRSIAEQTCKIGMWQRKFEVIDQRAVVIEKSPGDDTND